MILKCQDTYGFINADCAAGEATFAIATKSSMDLMTSGHTGGCLPSLAAPHSWCFAHQHEVQTTLYLRDPHRFQTLWGLEEPPRHLLSPEAVCRVLDAALQTHCATQLYTLPPVLSAVLKSFKKVKEGKKIVP